MRRLWKEPFRRLWHKLRDSIKPPLAGIQYAGEAGVTQSCVQAIMRYIHAGDEINRVYLLTCGQQHGFLLELRCYETIAIKTGFSSGYHGTGPAGLAKILTILEIHECQIEEYCVESKLLERLNFSALLQKDIQSLKTQKPVAPVGIRDYLDDIDPRLEKQYEKLRYQYPINISFRLLDKRLLDLALSFFDNEDNAVTRAYKRLEDKVRKRTGLSAESGSKLFSKAFTGNNPPLYWEIPDDGEAKGRANLFTATWMAFRNHRLHREKDKDDHQALREFMLLNELFRLESEALLRDGVESEPDDEFELLDKIFDGITEENSG